MTYSIQSTSITTTGTSLPHLVDWDTESLGETQLVGENRIFLQMGEYPESNVPGPNYAFVPALAFSMITPGGDDGNWGPWQYIPTSMRSTGTCYDGFSVALANGGFAIAYTTSPYKIKDLPNELRIAIFDANGNRVAQDLKLEGAYVEIDRFSVASDGSLSVLWTAAATGITYETIVKDGPTTGGYTATLNEDGAHTFSAGDFSFSSSTGATFAAVIIERLPARGELTLSGVAVQAGARIAVEDIDTLVWTPDSDAQGERLSSLTFRVVDSDGVVSGKHRLGFDVTGVDDAPEAKVDRAWAQEASTAIVDLLANDIDVDGDALAVVAATVVSGEAEVTLKSDGRIAVTYAGHDLAFGEHARVKVAYTVSDGSMTDDATLVVTFRGHADAGRSILGTAAADGLIGTGRAEHIHARQENDSIDGGAGADLIRGGSGNDRLIGGAGDDTLVGGDGRDEFVFDAADRSDDIVADFRPGHDRIVLRGFDGIEDFADITTLLKTEGANVVIRLGASTSITLLSTDPADLDSADFLF